MKHRLPAWTALTIIAAWLLRPLLTPAHVEGFSASIVSLGLHIARDNVAAYDTLHPVNLEFFELSRLGTSLAVALFASIPGVTGEWAMRATVWLGWLLLVGSSSVLVRRWTRAEPIVIAAALLLLPGLVENAFFYNDNVLSAGLAVTSLAIAVVTGCVAETACAGILFGLAVLARTDAVLLAPAIALAMFERDGLRRIVWLRAGAFAVAAFVPYVAILGAFGATPLDVLHISSYVVTLWQHGLELVKQRRELLVFIGIPVAVLGAVGSMDLIRRREWLRLALLAGVPVLFNLVYLGKLYQSRQALPLAPFFVALAVMGWQYLTALEHPRRLRLAAVAATAAMVLGVLAGPITVRKIDDGPRMLTGRVYGISYWTRWQDAVNRNLAELQSFASSVGDARTTAVLTDAWNSDRYLHLALQEQGYTLVTAGRVAPACARTAELFERDGRRVLHVRLHEPLVPSDITLRPERYDGYAAPCLAGARPAHTFLLAPVTQVDELFGPGLTTEWSSRERPTYAIAGYTPSVAVLMDSAAFGQLRHMYSVQAEADLKAKTLLGKQIVDLATAERQLSARVATRR